MPIIHGILRQSIQILTGLAVVLLSSGLLLAQPADVPTAIDADVAERDVVLIESAKSKIEIVEKFSRVIELKNRIIRVDGFDPAVLNVTALSPYQIRVQALTPGVTSLVLFDENSSSFTLEVFVNGDARHLQAYLNQHFPNANVEAIKVKDSVLLRGWVTQPEHINAMVEIAEQFYPKVLNQIQVGGVQQVLLKVKVMEIQRGLIRRMGVNWVGFTENAIFSSTPGELVRVGGITNNPASATLTAASLGNPTAILGFSNDNVTVNAFLDALKQEALLDILAEPELVVMNGRPANLLSGGEFPILVPQSLGTVTIQWKEFGTRLEAVPLILGQGKLRLELHPEVSERDFTNSVQVNGLTVPGLTTRRVNTQVEMKFGQTLMIAGLIANRRTTETNKVPFLGELPFIGAAFRRLRDNDAETELVIMVTPELVAPLDPSQIPPGGPGRFTDTPTDRELYIDGMLEVPKYGDPCVDCEEDGTGYFPAQYMNDPREMMPTMPATMSPGQAVPSVPAELNPTPKSNAADPIQNLNPASNDMTSQGPRKRTSLSNSRRPGLVVPAGGAIEPRSAGNRQAIQQTGGNRGLSEANSNRSQPNITPTPQDTKPAKSLPTKLKDQSAGDRNGARPSPTSSEKKKSVFGFFSQGFGR